MAPSSTSHAAARRYQPQRQRSGVALVLSGGGYRAALFHLGAVRRLNESGLLSRVTTISSVSGGSILAALLVTRVRPWPAGGAQFADFDSAVARPLRELAGTNVRTPALLERLKPWNWLNTQAQVQALGRRYQTVIGTQMLWQLPQRPRAIFCATDLTYAANWVFESRRMGDYQAGYQARPAWPLASAVAASSCCPPFFQPLRLSLGEVGLRGGKVRNGTASTQVALTDGGLYDNLGLEPVWKDHAVLLVSDGGSPLMPIAQTGPFWRIPRYLAVMASQSASLRKRWLIGSFLRREMTGAYWGIGSAAGHYGADGFSEELVDSTIARVRTDLDAFSQPEQAVLENHGYLMAEAAIKKHLVDMVDEAVPCHPPHPDWLDESRVRLALKDSHRRRIMGRW